MEFRFAEEQPQDDYAAELAGFNWFCYLAMLLLLPPLPSLLALSVVRSQ